MTLTLDGVKIDCKIADATSPDWDSIWDELCESDSNPVEVEKIGFSSALTRGYIVPCDFSYSQEQEPLSQDAFAPLRDVMVHSWKAVTRVLSFSFMTRITRNRCLPIHCSRFARVGGANVTQLSL